MMNSQILSQLLPATAARKDNTQNSVCNGHPRFETVLA